MTSLTMAWHQAGHVGTDLHLCLCSLSCCLTARLPLEWCPNLLFLQPWVHHSCFLALDWLVRVLGAEALLTCGEGRDMF